MAVIEDALRALVLANGTVSGLIGTRYYPLFVPADATLPAVAYQRISGPRIHSHDGASELALPRFQWGCKAASYSAAKGLANAVRASIDGYKGTTSGVRIGGILVENEIDLYDERPAEQANSFTILLDAVVWHEE